MNPDNPAVSVPNTAADTQLAAWPGAFGIFKHSKHAVLVNLWPIVGIGLLNVIASAFNSYSEYQGASNNVTTIGFVCGLLSLWFTIGLIRLYLAGVRDEKLNALNALKVSPSLYLKMLAAMIISGVLVGLSLVALIIPFFFVMPRLLLVDYFLVDRKLGPIKAIKASWKFSKGHSLKVWSVLAVTILFSVLCFVLVGIYFLFFYQAAFAVLYSFMARPGVVADAASTTQPAPPVLSDSPAPTSTEPQ